MHLAGRVQNEQHRWQLKWVSCRGYQPDSADRSDPGLPLEHLYLHRQADADARKRLLVTAKWSIRADR